MNANELLASIAGLSNVNQNLPEVDIDCEEVSYDEMEDVIYDEEVIKEQQHEEEVFNRKMRPIQRELRGLYFANPGTEMSKQLPDSSDIVSSSRARRAHPKDSEIPTTTTSTKEKRDVVWHHDKTGKLTSTTRGHTVVHDLCDCLRMSCNGCQWPCKSCKSRKCMSGLCRQNRKELIGKIEEMYTVKGKSGHHVETNPFISEKFS